MKFIIKIKFLENIINIDCMFKECEMLSSVKSFSKFNTKYLRNVNFLFSGCCSLQKIDDIFYLDLENSISEINGIFFNCFSLKSSQKLNWI